MNASYSSRAVPLTAAARQPSHSGAMPSPKPRPGKSTGPVPASAGRGVPATPPRPQRPRTEQQTTPQDAAVESTLALPHERDESVGMTPGTVDPVIRQAARDVQRGVKDTSKSPEMDRAYRKL